MSAETLKTRLEHLQGSFDAPDDVWELTQRLLEPEYLGHPDPHIRDELVYPALYTWITQALSAEQLRYVLRLLLDSEHLFFKLGQVDDETVLVRSFTLLQIVAVLDRQQQEPCLATDEVRQLVPVLLRYLDGEQDLRGYDVLLGWLHAAGARSGRGRHTCKVSRTERRGGQRAARRFTEHGGARPGIYGR